MADPAECCISCLEYRACDQKGWCRPCRDRHRCKTCRRVSASVRGSLCGGCRAGQALTREAHYLGSAWVEPLPVKVCSDPRDRPRLE